MERDGLNVAVEMIDLAWDQEKERADAAEARIATIERETLERAAVVAEEAVSGKCTKCGHPRNNHPYRHPFTGVTTGDIPAAIRAMIEEKTDE